MMWRAHVHEAGFLAVVVALAGLLVSPSVSSYRGDLALTEALVEGLFHLLRERAPRPQGRPPPNDMLLANQPALAAEGLRRVAVIGPRGEVIAASGEPAAERAGLASGVPRIVRPLHGPPRPPPHGPPGEGPHAQGGPRPGGPPPRLGLKYEPRLALDLHHRARHDLIASLAVAVARRGAELHGGRVTIDRRPGGGSVFVLWLPPGRQEDT